VREALSELMHSSAGGYAAPFHSRKYRRWHAPATNLDPGTSSPDQLHRHSLAASPARSVPVAHSLRSLASPVTQNTASRRLSRRSAKREGGCAHSRLLEVSPLGLSDSLTRSPLRRLAPCLWLVSAFAKAMADLAEAHRAEAGAALTRVWSGLCPSDSPTASLARAFALAPFG